MMDAREPTHFETRPTEDVGEVSALLWVNETFMHASTTITTGTTLAAFLPAVPKGDALTRGFGDYLLSAPAGKRDGYHGYLFAKPKTAVQKRTPFRSVTKVMPVSWPNWLRNLHGGMVERVLNMESGASGATATSNTVTRREFQDRYELIPGGQISTEVMEEEFHSPTPFTDLDSEIPVPTHVRYFYKGTQLSIDCLHDDVFVPEETTGFERDDEFGMIAAQELPPGQFFPRTNFIGWQPFTLTDTQELVDGVWRRFTRRITKLPPLPEAIRF
jgi:hypothetical protein